MIRAVSVGYDVDRKNDQFARHQRVFKATLRFQLGDVLHRRSGGSRDVAARRTSSALGSLSGDTASFGNSIWKRDSEHVEKAFDFMGMGARNGVMAATMVADGLRGVDDPFNGSDNFFTALADKPQPESSLPISEKITP